MILCGMSEVDITPPIGESMPGYFNDRKTTGIVDLLYAKAMVVESKGTIVAFIVLDCCDLKKSVVNEIRERVYLFTGISPSNVMISATHTHTGPPVETTTFIEASAVYLDWMVKKAADAAIMAYNNRREAQIGFGSGHEGDMAFNRRFFMKDGTVETNPGVGNPQVVRSAGPIDPQVSVIRIDDVNGVPIGVVTNYALHTDIIGGLDLSADFPGELSVVLKKVLGTQVISMFMMGASGNINHHDVFGGKVERDNQPLYLKIGRVLAGEVLKVREKINPSRSELQVDVRQAWFPVNYRKPTEENIQAARHTLLTKSSDHVQCNVARELLAAADSEETSAEVEIQAIRIGDFAVAGLPAELFVEFGLEIKEKSPFKLTLINELCNGSVSGYICTREAYKQGGYEPKMTSNNKLAEEAGEIFVHHALELLHDL